MTWRDDLYRAQLPGPAEVLLVDDVTERSVASDRELKLLAYGEAGIPEAWLVDLVAEVVEAQTGPGDGGYRDVVVFGPGEELAVTAVPELAVPVSMIL